MANTNQMGLGTDLLGRYVLPSGLGADLLGVNPVTQAPAAVDDDGAAPVQAQTPPAAADAPASPRLTGANVQLLGRILTSECGGVCSPQEVQAVGSTFINRMNARKTDNAADVLGHSQYATNKAPTQEMLDTATQLLSGQLGDNTGGAMNFYSPRSMPKEGDSTARWDIGGGLEYVPGSGRHTTLKNYRPGFANTLKQRSIPGVSDWHLKVYGPP